MDNIKFNILQYYHENGSVDLNDVERHFHYDITDAQFSEAINYLIGKRYLKDSRNELAPCHEITEPGRQVLNDISRQNNAESIRRQLKENLELENLTLQNDQSRHQIKLRKQQAEIDRLTVQNLKLQNRQLRNYILFSIISFIFGLIATNIPVIREIITELSTK